MQTNHRLSVASIIITISVIVIIFASVIPVISSHSSTYNKEVIDQQDTGVIIESTPNGNGTRYTIILTETISLSDTIVVTGTILVVLVYKAPPSYTEKLKERAGRSWQLRLLKSGLVKSIMNANRFFGPTKRIPRDAVLEPPLIRTFLKGLSKYPRLVEMIFLPLGMQNFSIFV
jgi:hypothetical protein